MARERRTRRPVLSIVAEEQLLLPAAPPHLHAMITATLDTGMRRGEITNQLWEDVDFPRRVLFVTRSKTPEGESREIPLTARLFKWLSENRRNQGAVFGYHGEQVQFVKRSWKTTLKNAGIRHVRSVPFDWSATGAEVTERLEQPLPRRVSGSDPVSSGWRTPGKCC